MWSVFSFVLDIEYKKKKQTFLFLKIIITRPKENIEQYPPDLNIEFMPVFEYKRSKKTNIIDCIKKRAFILTSQEASRFVVENNFSKEAVYYCVGKTTAQFLLRNHFNCVVENKGVGALDLLDLIYQVHDKKIPLHYLSGKIIKHPLHELLNNNGFNCTRHVVYETVQLEVDINHFKDDEGVIVFYSYGTYEFFLNSIYDGLEIDFGRWIVAFILPFFDRAIFLKTNIINWSEIWDFKSMKELIEFVQKR